MVDSCNQRVVSTYVSYFKCMFIVGSYIQMYVLPNFIHYDVCSEYIETLYWIFSQRAASNISVSTPTLLIISSYRVLVLRLHNQCNGIWSLSMTQLINGNRPSQSTRTNRRERDSEDDTTDSEWTLQGFELHKVVSVSTASNRYCCVLFKSQSSGSYFNVDLCLYDECYWILTQIIP